MDDYDDFEYDYDRYDRDITWWDKVKFVCGIIIIWWLIKNI